VLYIPFRDVTPNNGGEWVSLPDGDQEHKHAIRYEKEFAMKDSTKDKAEGKAHEVKGAIKETIGHAINKPDLEAEGKAEKVGGKVQKKVGDIEKVVEK
jgi:uncharacterized protein YjbJ (UPF0337 family)